MTMHTSQMTEMNFTFSPLSQEKEQGMLLRIALNFSDWLAMKKITQKGLLTFPVY